MLTYLLLGCWEWGCLGCVCVRFYRHAHTQNKCSNSSSANILGCPDAVIFRKLNWVSVTPIQPAQPNRRLETQSLTRDPLRDGQEEPAWYGS